MLLLSRESEEIMIGTNTIVDISHLQGLPDFSRVSAAGIANVFHKATEGVTWADPNFARNRAAIHAAGLQFGAYHFGRPDDGVEQAQFFLKTANPQPGDLLVLDFEQPPNGAPPMTADQARAFVQVVHSAIGVWPGIYGSPSFLTVNLGAATDPVLSNCWLWLAQYDASISSPTLPGAWPAWTLWQYTDGSHGSQPWSVDGISSNCDRDTFNGSPDQLTAFWQNSAVPAPTAP